MPERTPNYDPRNNSKIINFLLTGIDGGFLKGSLPCACDDSKRSSASIKLGQFPLYSETAKHVLGVLCILSGGLGIYFIVGASVQQLSLYVAIPLTVVSLAFTFVTGAGFYFSPIAQHRYVLVELDCENCGENHSVLYDCITKQKRRRFGIYTSKKCVILHDCVEKHSHSSIETAFEEMRNTLDSSFNPWGYNCKTWADELYLKVTGIQNDE